MPSRLFVQLAGAQNKENTKAPHYRPFVRGPWTPHEGPIMAKVLPCHHNISNFSASTLIEFTKNHPDMQWFGSVLSSLTRLPGMSLFSDLRMVYSIQLIAINPPLVSDIHSPRIICRGVSHFPICCPCFCWGPLIKHLLASCKLVHFL